MWWLPVGLLFWVGITSGKWSVRAEEPSRVFWSGEELAYRVRWGPLTLGWITVRLHGDTLFEGRTVRHASTEIRSVPAVSALVNISGVYHSYLEELDGLVRSRYFWSREQDRGDSVLSEYRFDYLRGRVLTIRRSLRGGVEERAFPLRGRGQDGISVFYFTRLVAGGQRRYDEPTWVSYRFGTTEIEPTAGLSVVRVPAVPYPVAAWCLRGVAHFEGLLGFKGPYEGWFSADEARVPLRARLSVIVGYVQVELIAWKRKGWNPPRASIRPPG
mgnify:CR=1 FL=1|jgi:hypothetical protein|nr:MAG: hypothetical protein KatS3mg041_0597 [Bacteroidota bacterium]